MKKKRWPKLPRYLIPLFSCATVYLCRSREEWQQAEEYFNTTISDNRMLGGATQTFTNPEQGENCYLLGIFNGDLPTLVHECAHVAFYVCRDCGIRVEPGAANETYCYLLDRLFSYFCPFIQEPENGKDDHKTTQGVTEG